MRKLTNFNTARHDVLLSELLCLLGSLWKIWNIELGLFLRVIAKGTLNCRISTTVTITYRWAMETTIRYSGGRKSHPGVNSELGVRHQRGLGTTALLRRSK